MRIRLSTNADLVSLAELASRTFLETYDDLDPEDAQPYVEEFFRPGALAQHIASPGSRIFVVEADCLVGYTLLTVNAPPLPFAAGPYIECVRFFLDRAIQGKGLGGQLLNKALCWADDNNYGALWLKVWDANSNAIAFYERHGFSRLGSVPYTEGGMNDSVLIMARALKQSHSDGC